MAELLVFIIIFLIFSLPISYIRKEQELFSGDVQFRGANFVYGTEVINYSRVTSSD